MWVRRPFFSSIAVPFLVILLMSLPPSVSVCWASDSASVAVSSLLLLLCLCPRPHTITLTADAVLWCLSESHSLVNEIQGKPQDLPQGLKMIWPHHIVLTEKLSDCWADLLYLKCLAIFFFLLLSDTPSRKGCSGVSLSVTCLAGLLFICHDGYHFSRQRGKVTTAPN